MPQNFQTLTDAWDDPEKFAREVSVYYEHLRANGRQVRPRRSDAHPREEATA